MRCHQHWAAATSERRNPCWHQIPERPEEIRGLPLLLLTHLQEEEEGKNRLETEIKEKLNQTRHVVMADVQLFTSIHSTYHLDTTINYNTPKIIYIYDPWWVCLSTFLKCNILWKLWDFWSIKLGYLKIKNRSSWLRTGHDWDGSGNNLKIVLLHYHTIIVHFLMMGDVVALLEYDRKKTTISAHVLIKRWIN